MEALDRFCTSSIGPRTGGGLVDPACLADRFVHAFSLSPSPRFEEITSLLRRIGIRSVRGSDLGGRYRGIHYGMDGGCYHIEYEESEGQGSQEHTLLHETYEIIHERLEELQPGLSFPRGKRLCRSADRFAAAVLMQPEMFSLFAETTGFDVTALQRAYRRSHVTITLRLAEVMRHQPLLAALYQLCPDPTNGEAGDITLPESFTASVVAGTPGFTIVARPGSRLSLEIPRRGRPVSPGTAVDQVLSTGRPAFLQVLGGGTIAGEAGIAIAARPVVWQDQIEKVAFVAVPLSHRPRLSPRIGGVPLDLNLQPILAA